MALRRANFESRLQSAKRDLDLRRCSFPYGFCVSRNGLRTSSRIAGALCACLVLLIGGCDRMARSLYLSGCDRDIRNSTRTIETAGDDAGRAAGYAQWGPGVFRESPLFPGL